MPSTGLPPLTSSRRADGRRGCRRHAASQTRSASGRRRRSTRRSGPRPARLASQEAKADRACGAHVGLRYGGRNRTAWLPASISPMTQVATPSAAAAACAGGHGLRGQHGDEPHAEIEDFAHFLGGDLARLLQVVNSGGSSQARDPRPPQSCRQYPHQIPGDSSAGDVGQAMHPVEHRAARCDSSSGGPRAARRRPSAGLRQAVVSPSPCGRKRCAAPGCSHWCGARSRRSPAGRRPGRSARRGAPRSSSTTPTIVPARS